MEKFSEVNDRKQKSYQKYQKYISKAFTGVLIGVLGLIIPTVLLNQLNDTMWAIGMLGKIALTGFGFAKTLVNAHKADKAKVEFECESEKLYEIGIDMQKELELSNDKNKEYEKKLKKVKDDYGELKEELVAKGSSVTKTSNRAPKSTSVTKGRTYVKTK